MPRFFLLGGEKCRNKTYLENKTSGGIMKKNNYFITVQNDILESELISSRAKLLYGYIVSLSQQKGYCFATNKHFAEKFGVCRKTITRDLKELSKANCI